MAGDGSGAFARLSPGDQFVVKTKRGTTYEATFLWHGPEAAGLYVRISGKLGRLKADMCDPSTFEHVVGGHAIAVGDELLVEVADDKGGGKTVRGSLVDHSGAGLVISTPPVGDKTTVPLRRIMTGTMRLLFPTEKLFAGEEFVAVMSDGKELRGTVQALDGTKAKVLRSDGERVELDLAKDLNRFTMNVLVPTAYALDEKSYM